MKRAISTVELIIAVAILGLVAAIAIPRLSQGASRSDQEQDLRRRLKTLRTAIELYYQDHSVFPGNNPDDPHPPLAKAAALFEAQLSRCTDSSGKIVNNRGAGSCGPYLGAGIPKNPFCVPRDSAQVLVVSNNAESPAPERPWPDWIYNRSTGEIRSGWLEDQAQQPD